MMAIMLFATSVMADDIFVTAELLNGRRNPNRRSEKEALYDCGDVLHTTGVWSKDHKWIEVEGGECPTVWVSIDYVSETLGTYFVENREYKQIKIRKSPVNGRVTGYLRKGKQLEIDRVVLGWGHCSLGWIDLSLVAEVFGDDYEGEVEQ